MSEPKPFQMIVLGSPQPRPRGRPKADEPSTPVSAWVKNSEYDKLVRLANKRETSVSSLVRDLIRLRLP